MFTKIQQKPHLNRSSFQVIDQLKFMLSTNGINGFEFQNNPFVYQKVSIILSYLRTFIEDIYFLLRLTAKSPLQQFLVKRILINTLQKAIS